MKYLKQGLKTFVVTSGLLVASMALAAPEASSTLKLSTILEKLNQQGYSNIHDVEREHGILKIEGINDKGIKYEIHIDPKSGDILKKQHHIKTRLSALDIAKKLEAKGYKQIDEIEFDEGVYKVKVLDKNQKEIELHVDPNTGEIEKD